MVNKFNVDSLREAMQAYYCDVSSARAEMLQKLIEEFPISKDTPVIVELRIGKRKHRHLWYKTLEFTPTGRLQVLFCANKEPTLESGRHSGHVTYDISCINGITPADPPEVREMGYYY